MSAQEEVRRNRSLALPVGVVFLSAFLLFQVQPLVGRLVLPRFGGGAGVWTTCLLFFQILLLAGYLYAHLLVARLSPRRQLILHGSLLFLACLTLPLRLGHASAPGGEGEPTLRLLALLAWTVGLPYLLLSTTGPLVQAWVAREGRVPYRLFALSNLGSLLALLSYPVLVEPFFTLRTQRWAWSGAFLLFSVLLLSLAWRQRQAEAEPGSGLEALAGPGAGQRILWIALAAVPSVLLMAVTGHLSTNVAPIPFLWVGPLSLYLLSFILCFDSDRWYRRGLFLVLLPPSLLGLATLLTHDLLHIPVGWQILAFGTGLFVLCMVGHGELAGLRPHPRHLTSFYLCLSLGGGLGGLFVAVAAPRLFNSYLELPLGLAACAAAAFLVLARDPGAMGPWLRRLSLLTFAVLAGGLGAFTLKSDLVAGRGAVARGRNFYGTLSVTDDEEGGWRSLAHGTITHGGQFLDPEKARLPVTYYGPDSGAGLALRSLPEGPRRIGIVGLGAGSLAAWGRKGDLFRFYDINPLVERFARRHFTYLASCAADTEVILGDARLSLEREAPQAYDLLAVDAFSSDAIPVHLLTLEALRTYLRHLRPGGILAVHVSNRYLHLDPVLRAAALRLGLEARVVDAEDKDSEGLYASTWILLARDASFFEGSLFKENSDVKRLSGPGQAWTDDFSNLFRLLK